MARKAALKALDVGGSDSDEAEQPVPQLKRKRPEVSVDDLAKHGFRGGPSVLSMLSPEELEKAKQEAREERKRAAAAKQRRPAGVAPEPAEDAAVDSAAGNMGHMVASAPAGQQRQPPQHEDEWWLRARERAPTQGDRRGAELRAAAAAQMRYKFASCEALGDNVYSGAAAEEKEQEHQARQRLAQQRSSKGGA